MADRERGAAPRPASVALALLLALCLGCTQQDDGPAATPTAEETPPKQAVVTAQAPEPDRPAADSDDGTPSAATPSEPTAAQDMLTALRLAVEAELAQGIRLEIDEQRGDEQWSFVTAVARGPDGAEIDYTTTKYAGDVEDGVFDDWLCALLEKDGGLWRVVALEIGATDVPFVDWPERYGVPPEIVMP